MASSRSSVDFAITRRARVGAASLHSIVRNFLYVIHRHSSARNWLRNWNVVLSDRGERLWTDTTRQLSLTERKRDLARLCRRSRTPLLKQVETFPDGEVLFDHCNRFGFEGVVSKRLASRYSSGPSRNWVKVKCPDWKRINAGRHKLFEAPRTPELTEAQKTLTKKRQELARVLERLQAPHVRPGIARELRKHADRFGRENAELEQG